MSTPDRIQIELILSRLDDAIEEALAYPDGRGHPPEYAEMMRNVLAGSELLQREIGEDPPDGPILGLVMCAMALEVISRASANDRKPPSYFRSKLGDTLTHLRDFRARLDELDA